MSDEMLARAQRREAAMREARRGSGARGMIRVARLAMDVTQEQAAAMVGITKCEWSYFETRRRVPSAAVLERIAAELNIDPLALSLWCSRGRVPDRYEALVDDHPGLVVEALERLLGALPRDEEPA